MKSGKKFRKKANWLKESVDYVCCMRTQLNSSLTTLRCVSKIKQAEES